MATIKSFEEINAWQRARVYAHKAFQQTTTGAFAKDFELKNQVNGSAGSIMDNIAEGFGRGGNREFINFLSYARGSADESRSQVYRAFDRGYISKEVFEELRDEALEIVKMITGFMHHLQNSEVKGYKFLEPEITYSNIASEE